MERPVLASDKVSDLARDVVANFHRTTLDEVIATVNRDRVVVVGMAQNPVVKNVRKFLDARGVKFTYLEYGSYLSKWKERLSIKLWAGFPTFPMVFLDGKLIGGLSETTKWVEANEFPK